MFDGLPPPDHHSTGMSGTVLPQYQGDAKMPVYAADVTLSSEKEVTTERGTIKNSKGPTRMIIALVLGIVIIGAAVGGGVGGSIAAQKRNQKDSSSSETSPPNSSDISLPISSLSSLSNNIPAITASSTSISTLISVPTSTPTKTSINTGTSISPGAPSKTTAPLKAGRIDVGDACRQQWGSSFEQERIGDNAYDWRCVNGEGLEESVDFTPYCSTTYGAGSYPDPGNGGIYDWVCFHN